MTIFARPTVRTATTRSRAATRATETGNRMPNVWIERVLGMRNAWQGSIRSRPRSPRIRSRRRVGTSTHHHPPRGSRRTMSLTWRHGTRPHRHRGLGCDLAGRDVLVQLEEVVRIVRALERLEAIVLPRSIGLADPVLTSSIRKFTYTLVW